jgi:polar amino acid transport system substrate-binding protein
MFFRKIFAHVASSVTLFALFSGVGVAHATKFDEIQAKGVITVATEDDFKPFEFIVDGKPMGLDHDLLALYRKQVKFRVDQQIIPWAGLLPGVTTGKYDVALTAVVVTGERAKSLDFTMPIAEATQFYAVRADDVSIKSIADLNGKTVGVQAGGGSFAALSNLRKLLTTSGGSLGRVVQYRSFPVQWACRPMLLGPWPRAIRICSRISTASWPRFGLMARSTHCRKNGLVGPSRICQQ